MLGSLRGGSRCSLRLTNRNLVSLSIRHSTEILPSSFRIHLTKKPDAQLWP